MNKKDLIDAVYKDTHVKKQDVEVVINAALHEMINCFKYDEPILIRGFGVFDVIDLKSRRYSDLNNKGKLVILPPRRKVKFRESDTIREILNR